MAREHHETTSQQQQRKWGTLELLLLVCAVNRHGTESWDSIAMEVQNRGSTLSSLTPQDCRDKFNETRRRFMAQNDVEPTCLVPLVDQLRQIRVQELRAEVQRRDVSIVSLELKVKRLEEERKKSLKSESDLARDRKESPATAVDGDGDSNRSFNESNSTTQKTETTKKKQNDDVDGEEEREPKMKPEPDFENDPVRIKSEPDQEDRNWSSNGKINGNVKDKTHEDNDKTASEGKVESVKNKASGVDESNESKREGKQSSDVQSCSSLSKNKRRRDGGEADEEEVSPATKKVLAVKSEPFVRILGMIRSHRLGSHFERRLRSQESERYKKLVRQHIDLRTIQSRLERGCYYNCFQKFFRDLLLLFNNFVMFFRKSSQEYAAAQELRALISKEMIDELWKQKPIDKPDRASSTMVVCGKRSFIKAIPSKNANSKNGDNKKESEVEEKPKVDNSLAGLEEKGVKKKTSQERSVSVQRKSTSSNKSSEGKHQYGGNELSSHDASESKKETAVKKMKEKEKKKKKKKQGAASFLQRMKQNSPSEVSDDESKDSKVAEEKRRRTGRKRDVKRERVEISSRGRGMKRGVGRPPMTTTTTEKRGGDNGESGGGGGGRNRKRTRR